MVNIISLYRSNLKKIIFLIEILKDGKNINLGE